MNFGALMGMAPQITSQAPGTVDAVAQEEKRKKKEGIASMLKGMGGADKEIPRSSNPGVPGFDVQGFLASLFGG